MLSTFSRRMGEYAIALWEDGKAIRKETAVSPPPLSFISSAHCIRLSFDGRFWTIDNVCMKFRHIFLFFVGLLFVLFACQPESRNLQPLRPEATAVVMMTVTATASVVPSRIATITAVSTNTVRPLPTLTVAPTNTAVAPNTPTAMPTAIAAVNIAGLPCPETPPVKPAYERNFLSPRQWPRATTTQFEPHFWFRDPISNGRKPFEQAYYPFGWDGGSRFLLHNGADMPKELGTAVLAVADGTVVVAQDDLTEMFGWRCNWYGLLVIIELDQRWQGEPVYVLYGHIQNIIVEAGDRVVQGDPVAETGVEGVSTVPHLHLEVRMGSIAFNATQNPQLWLPPNEGLGLLAGRLVDPEGRPWQGARLTLIAASDAEPQFISTFSYLDDPQQMINPDAQLAENFVFADLEPGFYTLFAKLQGIEYRLPVEIKAGEGTAVEIITEAYDNE